MRDLMDVACRLGLKHMAGLVLTVTDHAAFRM